MTRDLYAELAAYTERDYELVEQRCMTAATELAWMWPAYEGDLTAYYTDTDLYLFDLTRYQTNLFENGVHKWLADMVPLNKWRVGLDWGGGIGEWTIILAQAGVSMTYYDLPGPTRDYALWRFEREGVTVQTPTEDPLLEHGRYDVIVAMDVLEHLPEPEPARVMRRIGEHTNVMLCNPGEVKYNAFFPQHISHYNPRPMWRPANGGYAWIRNT